jgi:cytochrome c-type biogenesis protein CcmH/NrfF
VSRRPRITAIAVLATIAALATTTAYATTPKVALLSAESQLMCVSCHEPLELAQSPQAIQEKEYVAGLVRQGLTLSQIESNMVQSYGESVLAKPPAHGFNLTVYILPPAILVFGVAFLLYTLPKWRERSRQAAVTPLQGAPPIHQADAERLDDDLARFI